MSCQTPLVYHFKSFQPHLLLQPLQPLPSQNLLQPVLQGSKLTISPVYIFLPALPSGMDHLWKPAQYLYQPGFNQRSRTIRRFYRQFCYKGLILTQLWMLVSCYMAHNTQGCCLHANGFYYCLSASLGCKLNKGKVFITFLMYAFTYHHHQEWYLVNKYLLTKHIKMFELIN